MYFLSIEYDSYYIGYETHICLHTKYKSYAIFGEDIGWTEDDDCQFHPNKDINSFDMGSVAIDENCKLSFYGTSTMGRWYVHILVS